MSEPSSPPQPVFLEIVRWPRAWGEEALLAHVPGQYTLKLLTMRAGSKGNLQRHRVKSEAQYLLAGRLLLRYDPGDGTLVEREIAEGESWHVPPCTVHQEEALTDCLIVEASNPVFNDRERMEAQYGLKQDEGLPTTTLEEIVVG